MVSKDKENEELDNVLKNYEIKENLQFGTDNNNILKNYETKENLLFGTDNDNKDQIKKEFDKLEKLDKA